jgi:ubiquinone/menaquinone biosynthesis C-methylase UbiE
MKERFGSDDRFPPWTRLEHQARYLFALTYVKDASVIDAACGDGTGSALYAEAGARSVRALDINADCIRTAKDRHPGQKIAFEVSDCCDLKVQDRYADVFISLETIEHLQDDAGFLREVVRTLKPDGTFICSTPNRDVTNPATTILSKPLNPFHLREYSMDEFESLLRRFFRKVELYGQNKIGAPKTRVLRQLGKLLWLFCDRLENHQVQKISPGDTFEFIVAVCTQPMFGAHDAAR